MLQVLRSSSASENSGVLNVSTNTVGRLVFEVVDEGGWAGTIRVAARLNGRGRKGASTFATYLPVTQRSNGSLLTNTGVTAPGLYDVDTAGLEVQFQHSYTGGAASVYVLPILG